MKRINLIAVLFGDGFPEETLNWLHQNVDEWRGDWDVNYAVLTDRVKVPEPWAIIPFQADFFSKLKKLEMFRPDIFPGERCCYMDLDMSCVGPLGDLFSYSGKLGIREEFNPGCKKVSLIQSSLILFEGGSLTYLWEAALNHPNLKLKYPIGGGRGDQMFIDQHKREWDDLNALFPGQLISFKWGWRDNSADKDAARVVYHHGPGVKPHQLSYERLRR